MHNLQKPSLCHVFLVDEMFFDQTLLPLEFSRSASKRRTVLFPLILNDPTGNGKRNLLVDNMAYIFLAKVNSSRVIYYLNLTGWRITCSSASKLLKGSSNKIKMWIRSNSTCNCNTLLLTTT